MDTYYFDGCLSKFKAQVVDNKEVIIWVAIATLMVLVRRPKYKNLSGIFDLSGGHSAGDSGHVHESTVGEISFSVCSNCCCVIFYSQCKLSILNNKIF